MTEAEFNVQVSRLRDNFKNGYSDERLRLVWKAVNTLDGQWFRTLVDEFIGGARQAPLVPDFQNAAAEERERRWKAEKAVQRKDAHDFFDGKFSSEERRTVVQAITDRARGGVSDEGWATIMSILDGAVTHSPKPRCAKCSDRGVIIDESNSVWKCDCYVARADQRSYPRHSA